MPIAAIAIASYAPSMGELHGETDGVLEALAPLVDDLQTNIDSSRQAIELAEGIRALRLEGHTYSQILAETGKPLVVELITENLERLQDSGASLRQAHAAALHSEGMTMDEIAEIFGVSRQRISALIRSWRQGDSK